MYNKIRLKRASPQSMDGMIRTQKSSSFLTGFDALLLLLLHGHWLNWRKSRGIRLGTSLSEKNRTFLIAEKGSGNIRVDLYKKQQAPHKWSRNFTCTFILQLTLLDESIYLKSYLNRRRKLPTVLTTWAPEISFHACSSYFNVLYQCTEHL